ncbi:MAG: adenylosuccinate lyase, partial [Candidatus Aenigmarchaeota archaeon]|nr:adenylosuccinate lyase [Candidatus Aenigmarchaeota archaeon]
MSLKSVSPVDGRYQKIVGDLSGNFSEFALIKNRVEVETKYLVALSDFLGVKLAVAEKRKVMDIFKRFSEKDAERIKELEESLNHDIKAVEVFLRQRVPKNSAEYVHFCLTSEDVNSIAFGISINNALRSVIIPCAMDIIGALSSMAYDYRDIAMLSRTHGQPASPTTLGKELANYSFRLRKVSEKLFSLKSGAKFSGATGNYNAFFAAYPKKDWESFCKRFVESFGLEFCPMSTQIAPHDGISEILDCVRSINSICLDLSKNAWLYCSIGYLKVRKVNSEVGSSTMPHKINPIDFENAEGNFELSNSMLSFISPRLQLSRFQRDLSDSTIKRNYGVAFGHSIIAMK